MSVDIRSFETMVNATLNRIVNADVGITNILPGSVTRTLVEAILAESDITYFQLNMLYEAMFIDTARGDDLDRLVALLSVARNPATYAQSYVSFYTTKALTYDVNIPKGQIVSTKQGSDGKVYEFVIMEDTILASGELMVNVPVRSMTSGIIYIPANVIKIMNTPIAGISHISNELAIYGGTDIESDDELRNRAKAILPVIGKGTCSSLENAIKNIEGVLSSFIIDMARGVGTADIVVITAIMPPTAELTDIINDTIYETKAAGIDVRIVTPEVLHIDIDVNTTDGDIDAIGKAIIAYSNTLSVGDSFIINQMERAILNASPNMKADVTTIKPTANVIPGMVEVIRIDEVKINGVIWHG